jgi:hypothetical protein
MAVARQLFQALGAQVLFNLDANAQPAFVAQYFTNPRSNGGYDPRQHAIGLTFCVEIAGPLVPQGEAIDFQWFEERSLPASHEIGFGQSHVIEGALRCLTERSSYGLDFCSRGGADRRLQEGRGRTA